MFYSFLITYQLQPVFFWTNDFASWSPREGGREGRPNLSNLAQHSDKDLGPHHYITHIRHPALTAWTPIEYTMAGWWLAGGWVGHFLWSSSGLAWSGLLYLIVFSRAGETRTALYLVVEASYSANSQGLLYQSDLFQSKTSSLISCYTVWLPLPVKTSLYIYATRLYGIISTSNSSNSQISLETGSLKNTCLKYFLRLASSSNFSILNFNI